MKEGTMVDATIIAAPTSTKNDTGERDPEMYQTKKGDQWHFGMKAHIGADIDSGLVHTVVTTPANESDVAQIAELLHGRETTVHDGRAAEAEAVYRAELERNPLNGWSLQGLRDSLKAQGKHAEAAAVGQLTQAWRHADVQLVSSRF